MNIPNLDKAIQEMREVAEMLRQESDLQDMLPRDPVDCGAYRVYLKRDCCGTVWRVYTQWEDVTGEWCRVSSSDAYASGQVALAMAVRVAARLRCELTVAAMDVEELLR